MRWVNREADALIEDVRGALRPFTKIPVMCLEKCQATLDGRRCPRVCTRRLDQHSGMWMNLTTGQTVALLNLFISSVERLLAWGAVPAARANRARSAEAAWTDPVRPPGRNGGLCP